MIFQLEDKIPQIHKSAYVAFNANVIGNVIVGKKTGIWFQAIIRGDEEKIIIGDSTNIQDACVLHTDKGYELVIGSGVTVGHKSVLHGCTIADNCLLGMNSIILNGSKIGKNCIIGANTLIGQHKEIPDNSFVIGNPGRILRKVDKNELMYIKKAAEGYIDRILIYQKLKLLDRVLK